MNGPDSGTLPSDMPKKPLTIEDFARMGGKARQAKLKDAERSKLGTNAVNARWKKWRAKPEEEREAIRRKQARARKRRKK